MLKTSTSERRTHPTRTTSCPAPTSAENVARMFADAQLSSLTHIILIADADWHNADASNGNAVCIFMVDRSSFRNSGECSNAFNDCRRIYSPSSISLAYHGSRVSIIIHDKRRRRLEPNARTSAHHWLSFIAHDPFFPLTPCGRHVYSAHQRTLVYFCEKYRLKACLVPGWRPFQSGTKIEHLHVAQQ